MDAEELMNEVLAEAERFDDLQAMGNYSASPFSLGGVAARCKELGRLTRARRMPRCSSPGSTACSARRSRPSA